jgi:3-dehydroquinate synthase
VVIVTDSNVDLLYSDRLAASIREAGFDAVRFVFPAGEKSKNAPTLLSLLNFMAESRITRADTVFALGGGVVGDLAGLAASLYMRGVGLVQLPTTLLAAVDSSVGGKTAVDLPAGKNLMGAFYQPDLVICDTDTLDTLPPSEFSNGCAEMIKYAFIRDAAILNILGDRPLDDLISRCVTIKRDIVAADEHDRGERQLLNFGHTFGHAIEKYSGYTIPHGSAVAAGMVIMTTAAVRKGLCDAGSLEQLISALRSCGLPVETHYSEAELFDTILSDKKRVSDRITLVIPRRVGLCELTEVSLDRAREFLRLGLGGI